MKKKLYKVRMVRKETYTVIVAAEDAVIACEVADEHEDYIRREIEPDREGSTWTINKVSHKDHLTQDLGDREAVLERSPYGDETEPPVKEWLA